MYTYIKKKDWFTVCGLKIGGLQFLNIISTNKFAVLCSVEILCFLNFIIETICVTEDGTLVSSAVARQILVHANYLTVC